MNINIKYRIYSVDDKGMLERPTDRYGFVYNDYDSMDEVKEALIKAGDWTHYVVLPVTCASI